MLLCKAFLRLFRFRLFILALFPLPEETDPKIIALTKLRMLSLFFFSRSFSFLSFIREFLFFNPVWVYFCRRYDKMFKFHHFPHSCSAFFKHHLLKTVFSTSSIFFHLCHRLIDHSCLAFISGLPILFPLILCWLFFFFANIILF